MDAAVNNVFDGGFVLQKQNLHFFKSVRMRICKSYPIGITNKYKECIKEYMMKKTSKQMMVSVLTAVVLLCAITACGGGAGDPPGGPGGGKVTFSFKNSDDEAHKVSVELTDTVDGQKSLYKGDINLAVGATETIQVYPKTEDGIAAVGITYNLDNSGDNQDHAGSIDLDESPDYLYTIDKDGLMNYGGAWL